MVKDIESMEIEDVLTDGIRPRVLIPFQMRRPYREKSLQVSPRRLMVANLARFGHNASYSYTDYGPVS